MTRDEFQEVCHGFVDSDQYLAFRDVLETTHKKALSFNKLAQLRQKFSKSTVPVNMVWLELAFFLDVENEAIEFYGVQPMMMDMEQPQPEIREFPGRVLNGQIGQPQPVDWPKILQLCQTFNRNLPNPIALPFVRVARDETRTNSLYYRLWGVEYP